MKKTSFNTQILLESLCYGIFAGSMVYLAASGQYRSYITPKMKPYLYFTAVIMLIWCFVTLRRLYRPQHKKRFAHYLIILIPFLLLILPHGSITTSNMSAAFISGQFATSKSKKNITKPAVSISVKSNPVNDTTTSESSSDTKENSSKEFSPKISDDGSYLTTDVYNKQRKLHGFDIKSKTITISHKEFYLWINELYNHLDYFLGYKVSIMGFVYKNPKYMNKNEFIPARLLMSCCVADLAPYGIICKYKNVPKLKPKTWVTVEGIIQKGSYDGQPEPQIRVTKITSAPSTDDYVYPF